MHVTFSPRPSFSPVRKVWEAIGENTITARVRGTSTPAFNLDAILKRFSKNKEWFYWLLFDWGRRDGWDGGGGNLSCGRTSIRKIGRVMTRRGGVHASWRKFLKSDCMTWFWVSDWRYRGISTSKFLLITLRQLTLRFYVSSHPLIPPPYAPSSPGSPSHFCPQTCEACSMTTS